MPRAHPTPFKMSPLQPVREPFKDVAKTFPLKGADFRRVDRFVSGISKAAAVQRDDRTGTLTTEGNKRKSPKKARKGRVNRARKSSARRFPAKALKARKKIRFVQIEDVYVPIPQRRKAPAVIRIALPIFHTRKLRRRQKYMAGQPKVQATVSK